MNKKSISAVIIAVLVAGCATNGAYDTQASQKAKVMQESFNAAHTAYNQCVNKLIDNPQYSEFFSNLFTGKEDTKLDMLTNPKPISKKFLSSAKPVLGEWSACDAGLIQSIAPFWPKMATFLVKDTQQGDLIFIDAIRGKYKTYADLNRAWYEHLISSNTGVKKLFEEESQHLTRAHNDEINRNEAALAVALMSWSVTQQQLANSYKTYNVPTMPNIAPTMTNCSMVGNNVQCTTY